MPHSGAWLVVAFTVSISVVKSQNGYDPGTCMYGGAACPYRMSREGIRWPEFVSAITSCVQKTYVKLTGEGIFRYSIDNDGNSGVLLDYIDSVGYFEPFVAMALTSFYYTWIAQDNPIANWVTTRKTFDVHCRYTTPTMAQCLKKSPALPRSGKIGQAVQQMIDAWTNRYCVQPSSQTGGRRSFNLALRRRLAKSFTNMTAPMSCLMLTSPGTDLDEIKMSPNATTFIMRFYSECLDPEVLALLLTAFQPSDMAPDMNYVSTRMASLLYSMGRCGMRVLNDYCPAMLTEPSWNQYKFYIKTVVGKVTGRQLSDGDLNWNTSSLLRRNRTIVVMFGQRHLMTLADPFVETCEPVFSLPLTYVKHRYFSVSESGALDSSRLVTLSFYNDTPGMNNTIVAQYIVSPNMSLNALKYQGLDTLDGNRRTVVRIGNSQVAFTSIQDGFVKITDYRSRTVFIFRSDGPSITLTMSSPMDILGNSYGAFVRGCMFPVKPPINAPSADCAQACNATTTDANSIKWCAWDCTSGGRTWVQGYRYIKVTKALANFTDAAMASLSK